MNKEIEELEKYLDDDKRIEYLAWISALLLVIVIAFVVLS